MNRSTDFPGKGNASLTVRTAAAVGSCARSGSCWLEAPATQSQELALAYLALLPIVSPAVAAATDRAAERPLQAAGPTD